MQIQENIPLAPHTTFKIGGLAKFFTIVKNVDEIKQALTFAKERGLQIFFLGKGSNVLFSDSGFNGLVVRLENSGIQIIKEKKNEVLLKIASGENWDKIVEMAVKNNWWGIENLSHIPGSSGAIAIQNVGAYGQEARQIIESVDMFDIKNLQAGILTKKDCNFSYRGSVFNKEGKGKYVILGITIKLNKNPQPNLGYRDLAQVFKGKMPKISEIREAVILIRDQKYPYPAENKNGSAGSFFKNPHLSVNEYQSLLSKINQTINSKAADTLEAKKFIDKDVIKVPAALLIDLCGLKDMREGGAAINHNQPLVIINKTGKATAQEVLELAEKVKQEVFNKTGISLKFEPELVGF